MGFLAKSQTKKRMAAATAPLNAVLTGSPWVTTGAIPSDALVRGAIFGLGMEGLRSTTASSVSVFTPKFPPKLWLSTVDSKTYTLLLGLPVPAGKKSPDSLIGQDWNVRVEINTDDHSVTVVTAEARTLDDALVHADAHDAVRTAVLRALSSGELADAAAEARVSTAALSKAQSFTSAPPEATTLAFTITAQGDESAIWARLDVIGRRVLQASPGRKRWGLGLARYEHDNHVTLESNGHGFDGAASVASTSPAGRRIAAHDLRAFVGAAVRLASTEGSPASYQGPREWAP